MPIFFFDARVGDQVSPDPVGLHLADQVSAEQEAVRAAAEIGLDRLRAGMTPPVAVEVRDEQRRLLATVTIAMDTARAVPAL